MEIVHARQRNKTCEFCKKPFKVYVNEIRRLRGIFCCKSCAKKYNYQTKHTKVCPTCNQPFGTYINEIYCCEECKEQHTNKNNTNITDDESTNE